MKIAFFDVRENGKGYLKKKLKGNKLIFLSESPSQKEMDSIKNYDVLSVFIRVKVDKEFLSKFKNLKAVVTRSTGFDHIDLKECKRRKIRVYNVPNYGQNTVAEHAFALILALSRKTNKAYDKTVKGDFSLEGLKGFDLKGRTIGIVGMGSIGVHVARIAKGFEMKVLAYDLYPNKKLAKKLGFKYSGFKSLVKNSDIVTLHCPYTKKTHHLINSKNISLFKKDAILINTARGGLVDTTALIKSLKKKRIGGAGLDVLEGEEFIGEEAELLHPKMSKEQKKEVFEDHELMEMDNVILTPHMAFYSEEALKRILDTTIENVKNIGTNKKCEGLIQK